MNLEKILKKWKIKPKDNKVYQDAFTHTTYANENKEYTSYERLEFFGDALIDFEISKFLFTEYELNEGEMTLLRSKHVKESSFATWSKKLGLDSCIKFGNGSQTLITNSSVLADVFESFIAAVYLDAGRHKTLCILEQTLFKEIKKTWHLESKDSKTLLQEFLQASKNQPVKYITKQQKNKKFFSVVWYEGYNLGEGEGITKKDAEKAAASNALEKMETKPGSINEVN